MSQLTVDITSVLKSVYINGSRITDGGSINYSSAAYFTNVYLADDHQGWSGKIYWGSSYGSTSFLIATITNGSVSMASSQEPIDYYSSGRTIYVTAVSSSTTKYITVDISSALKSVYINGTRLTDGDSIAYSSDSYFTRLYISDSYPNWSGDVYWGTTSGAKTYHIATVTNGTVSMDAIQEPISYTGYSRTIYVTTEVKAYYNLRIELGSGITGGYYYKNATSGTKIWFDSAFTVDVGSSSGYIYFSEIRYDTSHMTPITGKPSSGSSFDIIDKNGAWTTNRKITGPSSSSSIKTVTLSASTLYQHSITYYYNNGGTGKFKTDSWSDSLSTIVSRKIISDEPTRDAYTFLGWDPDSSKISNPKYPKGSTANITASSQNYSLYAIWQDNRYYYKVHYFPQNGDANGYIPASGANRVISSAVTFYISALPTVTRAGYIYKGWNYRSSATTGYTDSIQLDITSHDPDNPTVQNLYAIWEKKNLPFFYWGEVSDADDANIISAGKPITNLTAARWNAIQDSMVKLAERVEVSYTKVTVKKGDRITADAFNHVRNGVAALIEATDGPRSTVPASVKTGDSIQAGFFNGNLTSLKRALNNAIDKYNNS